MCLREQYRYLPKDFIETASGHVLALVHWGVEEGRLLATLRYRRRADGTLEKLSTSQARIDVLQAAPHWLVECQLRGVQMTGVPVHEVVEHYRPEDAWGQLSISWEEASKLRDILCLSAVGAGVTGSFLVGANHRASDVDVVVYGTEAIASVRSRVEQAFDSKLADELSSDDWREAYARRGCEITFEAYCWHERRKLNKLNLSGTRVDISCVGEPPAFLSQPFRKIQRQTIHARVIDDSHAFALPAVYKIDHPTIQRIVSFTPTYTGQAKSGESIVACGWLEEGPQQQRQLLIGTSREATGEFLRVELGK